MDVVATCNGRTTRYDTDEFDRRQIAALHAIKHGDRDDTRDGFDISGIVVVTDDEHEGISESFEISIAISAERINH